jgi:hypothetical protein
MASTPPSALSAKKPVVLDAHLHVWPSPSTFTYAEGKAPPDALAEVSSAEALLEQFTKAGVDGCMIVQPINLGFDHTYVSSVIQKYPGKFRRMLPRGSLPRAAAAWTSSRGCWTQGTAPSGSTPGCGQRERR